jgi:predicted nucleic acid-binding protein
MTRLSVCHVLPIKIGTLKETWKIIEALHFYEANALQLASAKMAGANLFFTSDQELHKTALSMGLNRVHL